VSERNVFIVGCGYVGMRVGAAEQNRGSRVRALVRSAASGQRLRTHAIEPVKGDLDNAASLVRLRLAGALIYYFAPPPSTGTTDPRIDAFLAAPSPDALPERVVLISTSGVYGDCGGAWVDEDWPPNPQSDRARRRLAAEDSLRRWSQARGVGAVILRVPGIYGPGRLPVDRIRRAEPVLARAEAPWSNRVHVDDLVRASLAAADAAVPGAELCNVSDGHPTTMTDFFLQVADALGLPRPPEISRREAEGRLSAGMRSYLAESKRLDITRMRKRLGVEPRYPTLEKGLSACIVADPGGWDEG
jgi:nucleoside-diphosphate-sugar epimerase